MHSHVYTATSMAFNDCEIKIKPLTAASPVTVDYCDNKGARKTTVKSKKMVIIITSYKASCKMLYINNQHIPHRAAQEADRYDWGIHSVTRVSVRCRSGIHE